jgi:predicted CXXCH cytochrome family protein
MRRQSKSGRPKLRDRLLPISAASAICLIMSLAGCSSTVRHRWLNTFFDGVPDPNAPRVARVQPGTTNVVAAVSGNRPKVVPVGPALDIHKPYADHRCLACHQSEFDVAMRASTKEVCLACHQKLLPVEAKTVHDPVGNGDCKSCHDPHYSRNKFLLTRTGKAVCAECHDPEIAKPKSTHEPYENGECLSCHDPHCSVNKKLVLKTGLKLCFDCHDDFLAKAKFKHQPVGDGDCVSCHNPHASNNKALLVKDLPALCEDCHETKDIAAAKGHKNMGKAACLDCHDPHVGNDEYLLKPGKAMAKGTAP